MYSNLLKHVIIILVVLYIYTHVICIHITIYVYRTMGDVMCHMKPYEAICCEMPHGAIWPSWAIWGHMGPYGAICCNMVQYCAIWATWGHMGPYDVIRGHLVPYAAKWAPMGYTNAMDFISRCEGRNYFQFRIPLSV